MGEKIICAKTTSDNQEAMLVANTITEIHNTKEEAQHKDFTILYRTNAQSRALEESFRKKNIPYKIYGGISFYQRKEIKDLLAYFRLAINANDEEALKRIINYPTRGIGLTTLQKINITANNNETSMWEIIKNINNYETLINKGTRKKLENFSLMIDDFILKSKNQDAYTVAEEITKSTGLFNTLYADKTVEGVSRFENIQELLNGIKNFSEEATNETNNIAKYMEDIALLTDQDKEDESDFNKVTLMTVHAAKGLEFNYVFVVGLEENLFPSIMSGESQENLEEERRLFYVAITRAIKRLFLSYSSKRFKWGQFIDCEPSRFISEIEKSCIKEIELQDNAKHKQKVFIKNKFKKETTNKKLVNLKYVKNQPIKTSDLTNIHNGDYVKHKNFGKGKVIEISGEGANRQATVFFNNYGNRKLLLKFAKLEIL